MVKLDFKHSYLIVVSASIFFPLYILFAISLSGYNTDIWYFDKIVYIFLLLSKVYLFFIVKQDLKRSILDS